MTPFTETCADPMTHTANRLVELLVRSKKRLVPNLLLEAIPLYGALKRSLFNRLRQKEVTVHGFPFLLDPLDSLELSIFRQYEPFETSLLTAELRPGMTILDIGANIGYYSLLFSKLVGDSGRVYAFEPAPQNFSLLERNLARNHRRNVIALNQAVGNRSGQSFLYLSGDNHGDHQAYPSGDERPAVPIALGRVDDCVVGLVDLVKLDIQGFEAHALAGMEATIAANPNLILFTEFWPAGMERAGSDPARFLERLRSFDFEIFFIDEYANRLEPADDAALLRRYAPGVGSHTNLLCRRHASTSR